MAKDLICLLCFARRLLVSALLSAPFLLAAQQPSPATPTVVRDIVYTSDSTGTYRADLYRPAIAGPAPAIVLIHGGSWRSGSKRELRRLGRDLAAHGYVCFSIDYDLHPHSFPESWRESRRAVQFLRVHAAEYDVISDKIAVLGTSAGGQIAALLALAPEGPAPDAGTATPVPVSAAVIYNGGFDLHPRAYLLRRYLGDRCENIGEICKDASPDDHMHAGAPPFFVGHGTSDHLIPYKQATDFVALLQAARNPVTPFPATGAGHSYWKKRNWYAANLAATEDFLDIHLRAQDHASASANAEVSNQR